MEIKKALGREPRLDLGNSFILLLGGHRFAPWINSIVLLLSLVHVAHANHPFTKNNSEYEDDGICKTSSVGHNAGEGFE